MPRSADRRRLTSAQTAPDTSVPTSPMRYSTDIYPLRRAAEIAYEHWRMADADTEPVLYHEMMAADARLQVAIMDEQRTIGVRRDSAECGAAKGELLRRIGYGGMEVSASCSVQTT